MIKKYHRQHASLKKKIFLVGIKGVAMTSMAVYLKEKGYDVEGSDVEAEFATDAILSRYAITVHKGFHSGLIDSSFSMVIGTGAHGGMTNPQMQKAADLGLKVYMHGEYLGMIMEGKKGISVAGCHGKTTTSSMVALLLARGGYDPSYAIGTAEISSLGPGGHFGQGAYFVAEADEYMTCPLTCRKPRLLWQHPEMIVLTNIEYDHPDAYGSLQDVQDVYTRFIRSLPDSGPGLAILCRDDSNIQKILPLISEKNTVTYGFSPLADYRINKVHFSSGCSFMKVEHGSVEVGELMIRVPGRHNLLNALGASIAANTAGMDWGTIARMIKYYTGAKRRFEKIHERDNILLIDDYAHHPSEIRATISAARKWYPERRLLVIFQPHTYSRTKTLLHEFSGCFSEADLIILTDIFPSAREKADTTITSIMLEKAVNRVRNNSVYMKNNEEIITFLSSYIKNGDVIITMGAGDVYSLHPGLITMMNKISR